MVPSFYLLMGILAVLGIVTALWVRETRTVRRLQAGFASLEKSREKYRIITACTDQGIVIARNFAIQYANDRAFELLGMVREAELSGHLSDYIHPDDLGLALEHYERIMLANKAETEFTIRLLRPDKTALWVRVRSVSIQMGGEPANLSFIRDVTRFKAMEAAVQQAQRLEAIGALSGGIAHDFNNILTSIIGNAELSLMEVAPDDPGHEAFVNIQETGYRARDLVRQILTLTRAQDADPAPLCPLPVVKEAIKLLKASLPSHIRIQSRLAQDLDMVKINAGEFYQVLMNLCTNAKDAMADIDDGVLGITLETQELPGPDEVPGLDRGDYLRLDVRDNGAGIDPQIRDKVFEPYFTTKTGGTGTGLGLAASLKIIKNHGGTIRYTPSPDQGSCFSVFLPLAAHACSGSDSQDLVPVRGQGRILFVDDEQEICLMVKKLFENLGYEVGTAGSGLEALAVFQENPGTWDLLITDMGMPGMNGEQLIQKVRKIRPDLAVILCTGHSDRMDPERAGKTGVREYIQKPYSLKALAAMAHRLF